MKEWSAIHVIRLVGGCLIDVYCWLYPTEPQTRCKTPALFQDIFSSAPAMSGDYFLDRMQIENCVTVNL